MDSDDHMFEQVMKNIGVRPISEGLSRERSKLQQGTRLDEDELSASGKRTSSFESEDLALFLDAVQGGPVLDKDSAAMPQDEVAARRKPVKAELVDDVLDLHGHTVELALDELGRFVTRAFTRSLRSVVIITGKGKHSQGGVSVLRPRVEEWIQKKGGRYVRSYAEAPKAYGGKGAFILYLRPS